MENSDIRDHVFDALGKILVDKELIEDHTLFSDLRLDKDDLDEFFTDLRVTYGIGAPISLKSDLLEDSGPRTLTVDDLVNRIAAHMKDKKDPIR
jgi:hypothetical protein